MKRRRRACVQGTFVKASLKQLSLATSASVLVGAHLAAQDTITSPVAPAVAHQSTFGFAAPDEVSKPLTLFVATNGNDAWSGRFAAPNTQRTDGPVASLPGARDVIRRMRSNDVTRSKAAVTIFVRAGTYRLDAPFVLEAQDSGSANAPIMYAAYKNERPVVSGGHVLVGFGQRGKLWETTIPEVKDGRWHFRQLFVNGQRRQRARSPNDGYFRIAELAPGPVDASSKRAVGTPSARSRNAAMPAGQPESGTTIFTGTRAALKR